MLALPGGPPGGTVLLTFERWFLPSAFIAWWECAVQFLVLSLPSVSSLSVPALPAGTMAAARRERFIMGLFLNARHALLPVPSHAELPHTLHHVPRLTPSERHTPLQVMIQVVSNDTRPDNNRCSTNQT